MRITVLQVPLTQAIMGADKTGKQAGLYYMLKTKLALPFQQALRQDALGPAADSLNDHDKVVYSMVHCTYLSAERLCSQELSSWRQEHGLQ